MPEDWTFAQAAFVLNEPLDVFKKVVERGPVKARIARRGGQRVRKFALADLVFLHAERELKAELTPKGREELYKALVEKRFHGARHEVTFGHFTFEFGRHLKEIESKLDEIKKLSDEVDIFDGEAVIKGTHIGVHRIAALLDGEMTVAAVLRDYPSLNERQVLAAKDYAEINPKVGRPYPKMTGKAAIRSSGLNALDDEG